jgi:hypothetical protein
MKVERMVELWVALMVAMKVGSSVLMKVGAMAEKLVVMTAAEMVE